MLSLLRELLLQLLLTALFKFSISGSMWSGGQRER